MKKSNIFKGIRALFRVVFRMVSRLYFWRGFLRRDKPAAAIFLIIFSLFAGIYIWSTIHPGKGEAAWFNTNWQYRQTVAVANNGSAQVNYITAVTLDTQSLISAGKLQSNCNDIRFVSTSGKILPYFTDYCSNTASVNSVFFVIADSVPAGGASIYVYYGDSSAPSVSTFAGNPSGLNPGTGKDGSISISTDTNINTADSISGRTCSDTTGGDAVIYTSTVLSSSGATNITLATTPTTGCLAAGDEIMIIDMQGTPANNGSVGQYEFARVVSTAGTALAINHPLINSYDGTTQKIVIQRVPNYTNVTTSTAGTNFTPSAWNGTQGGIMAFRANGTVTVNASTTIDANGDGYAGGAGSVDFNHGGINGESFDGSGSANAGHGQDDSGPQPTNGGGEEAASSLASPSDGGMRGGGGGGGADGTNDLGGGTGAGAGGGYGGGGGGGGGNGSSTGGSGGTGGGTDISAGGGGGGCFILSSHVGANGGNAGNAGSTSTCTSGGTGGEVGSGATGGSGGGGANNNSGAGAGGGGGGIYGTSTLSTLYLGSGGGGGGQTSTQAGGAGGGIVYITAATVSVSGNIQSNGSAGVSGSTAANASGGGGSGGSVLINAATATLGSSIVTGTGGSGGAAANRVPGGGSGGVGRIATNYSTTTGSTNPSATATTIPVAGAASNEENGPAPSAYWKLDEGVGLATSDSSSNGNNGVLNNPNYLSWQSEDMCISGKCLYFAGGLGGGYVSASKTVSSVQSISFWVRPASSSAAIIDLNSSDASIIATSGTVSAPGISSPTIYVNGSSTNQTLVTNQWNYVTVTTNSPISASSIKIGNYKGNYMKGTIDDVRLYNFVLPNSQILADYNSSGVASGAGGAVLGANIQNSPTLSNGLAGYWKFDESSGDASDSAGLGNTLTNNSSTSYGVGKFGNAASLVAASTDFFSAGTTISGVQSVSFWVNPSASTDEYINLTSGAYITSSSGVVSATGFTNPSIYVNGTLNGTITANQWNHVVVTSSTAINANQFQVGKANGSYTNGSIDDVRLYSRLLSSSDVNTIYNWAPGPIAYYNFESQQNNSRILAHPLASSAAGSGTSMVTSSVTPSPNNLQMLAVISYIFGSTPAAPTVSGDGVTWVQVATTTFGNVLGTDYERITIFRAMGSAPTTGSLTISFGATSQTNIGYSWTEFSGVDTSGTNGSGAVVTSNSNVLHTFDTYMNISLSASADPINNASFGFFGYSPVFGSGTDTPGAGFARLHNPFWDASNEWFMTEWKNGQDGSVDESHSTGSDTGGLAVEIKRASGSFAGDTSGNDNSGLWNGTGNHSAQGEYGKAGNFNGIDDYVDTGTYVRTQNVVSVSAWVKLGSNTVTNYVRTIYTKGGFDAGGATGLFQLVLCADSTCGSPTGPGSLGIEIYTSGGTNLYEAIDTSSAPVNTWVHVVGTFDGTNLKFYKNGVLVKTTATTGSLLSNSNVGYIGACPNVGGSGNPEANTFLNGSVDELKVYNYALSQKQIVSLMNGMHPNVGSPIGSPIEYLKLDDGYGNVASNSGNLGSAGNAGLMNMSTSGGASGWSMDGKYGKAIAFDGINDYLDIPSNTALNITGAITISAWVKPANFSTHREIVSKGLGNCSTNCPYDAYITTGGAIRFVRANGSTYFETTSTSSVVAGAWNHILITDDGVSAVSIYLNGRKLSASTSFGSYLTPTTTSGDVRIGMRQDGATIMLGLIDELKIYNYALSASEVLLDYNRGSGIRFGSLSDTSGLTGGDVASNSASAEYCVPGDTTSCAAPVGRWDFEEGQGATAHDTSGSGADGVITGATYKPGYSSRALNFNGGSDTVTVGTSLLTNTVEFWVKPSSTTQNLIDLRTAATAANITVSGGTVTASGFTSPTIYVDGVVSSTLAANKWQFVAITTASQITANAIRFGRVSSTSLTGQLDGIRFYNYARSGAQIAWDYNRGAPLAYWKMDECQGTILNDSSGDGNYATVSLGASGTTTVGTCNTSSSFWGGASGTGFGKFNYAPTFDGTDDYAGLNNGSTTHPTKPSLPITFSAWINPTTVSGLQTILDNDSLVQATGYYGVDLELSGSQVWMQYGDGGTAGPTDRRSANTATGSIVPGNWYHIVGVIRGPTDMSIYFNGVSQPITYSGSGGSLTYSTSQGRIGRSAGGLQPFSGQIDDARIYNYPLTLDQVLLIYNQGSAVRFGPASGVPTP